MANGFKNMALAGGNGAAFVAHLSARRPGGMHWRAYQVGQSPCRPNSIGRGQLLAAVTEGLGLTDGRQLKI